METHLVRPRLAELDLNLGKRTHLYRLLYKYGPANGTLMLLPIDQGLEHGPRDFFANPESKNPEYQLRLAAEGGFSGIVFHVGLAEKYLRDYAGKVPLVLKLNGRTDIPSDKSAFSALTGTVEDAARLGADAVGYTLYIGSPAQQDDFRQFVAVRREAERCGLPLIVWAYPRGEAIEAKGGRDSFYAIDYAARVACELGADVIKLNLPKSNVVKDKAQPMPYSSLAVSSEEALRQVVQSAGRSLVILSGGERLSDDETLKRARTAMDAGATGLIFGRNVWQREFQAALALSREMRGLLLHYSA
jgi:fructose-bisphosphate aldolase, class I